MASNGVNGNAKGNGVTSAGRNGLPKITTQKRQSAICHDDSSAPVKAQTIDELHSLQKKKSAPTTPLDGVQGAFANMSEEDRHRQQLQSISASLASLTRESGPKLVRGDPARRPETPRVSHAPEHHFSPSFAASDSSLKFTHVLYNLSPAELYVKYEQAIKYEKGSFITSSGALATLSGAKTGRSPKDKRVVRDDITEDDLWWGKYVFLSTVFEFIFCILFLVLL
ncbi:phosphoenolpyruvate carboxykinase (ATP) 1-like [Rutidosis leptorrhynchoides]|uniref:phosphoenolpyruvate carboxykinase (ATP) 1-like n=1 Tax=Rutidosis leptorrhynchoides TaxID=125765 RepID=UPI003A99C5F6